MCRPSAVRSAFFVVEHVYRFGIARQEHASAPSGRPHVAHNQMLHVAPVSCPTSHVILGPVRFMSLLSIPRSLIDLVPWKIKGRWLGAPRSAVSRAARSSAGPRALGSSRSVSQEFFVSAPAARARNSELIARIPGLTANQLWHLLPPLEFHARISSA